MYAERQIDLKTISIAPNRQMTIPKKFYNMLGFHNEAECYVVGNTVVLKPKQQEPSGEFDEFILKDLIDEGYNGNELLEKFKEMRSKVPGAVQRMLADAKERCKNSNGLDDYKELFGEDFKGGKI